MKKAIFAAILMLLTCASVLAKQINFSIKNKMDHPITFEILSSYGVDVDNAKHDSHTLNESENATISLPVKSITRYQPIMLLQIENIAYGVGTDLREYKNYIINVYFSEQTGSDMMQTRFELLSQNNNDGHLVFDNNNATITLK